MTDFAQVIAADFAVPEDLPAAVDELTVMLAAADPVVRDDRAYPVLTTWIRRGVLDHRLASLGDAMVARLTHPEIQARTFAPLILAAVVDRDAVMGALGETAVDGWRQAFEDWWPAETEIRGWDDDRRKLPYLDDIAARLAEAFPAYA